MPNKKLRDQDGCPVDGETFGCLPKAGTELFKIYAVEDPYTQQEIDANPELIHEIGTVESTTDFLKSKFFDTRVFFRHVLSEQTLDVLGKRDTWGKKIASKGFNEGNGYMRYEKHIPSWEGRYIPGDIENIALE